MSSDVKKHMQKQALSALQDDTWAMTYTDKVTGIVALLVQLYLCRDILVKAGLIPGLVLPKLAQRIELIRPPTWLTAAAAKLPPFKEDEVNAEAAMLGWIKELGKGGIDGPLGLGIAETGDPNLAVAVFPPTHDRAALVVRLAALAGAPTSQTQGALRVVLQELWDISVPEACGLMLHAFVQPTYAASLQALTKASMPSIAENFTAPVLDLISKPANKEALTAAGKAYLALLTQQRAVASVTPVAGSHSASALIAAVAPVAAAPAPPVAAPLTAELSAAVVAAVTTAMNQMQYQVKSQVQQALREARKDAKDNGHGQRSGGGGGGGRNGGGGGGRRGGSGGGGNTGAGNGGGGNTGGTRVCYRCGQPGHLQANCTVKDSDLNNYDGLVSSIRLAAVDDTMSGASEWVAASQLRAAATVRARPTAEPRQIKLMLDTGAPISAIDEAETKALGCVVAPYKGPRLATLTGSPIQAVGQTSLHVELEGFKGVVGPIAVVRQLAWPVLLGVKELAATGALHVDFSHEPPGVQFGPAAAASQQAAHALEARVAALEARPLREMEGVPELRVASRLARDVDRARLEQDSAERPHAVPVPAVLAADAQHNVAPAIDFHDPAEVAYRAAYQEHFKDAYKQVRYGDNLTAEQRAELEAIVYQHRECFGLKETGWMPPVMDVSQPNAAPQILLLRPGVQAQSVPQPPYASRGHSARLQEEAEAYLRTGRGKLAGPLVLSVANSFIANERVVHAFHDANRMLLTTANTLESTDKQVRDLAAAEGVFYNQFDARHGFGQWPVAKGAGAAACIRCGNETIEPQVAQLGINSTPGGYNRLMTTILRPTAAELAAQPLLDRVTARTFMDDTAQAMADYQTLKCGLQYFLGRCKQYGITLTAPKCGIGLSEVEHCGIKVRGRVISASSDYTKIMLGIGQPQRREQLVSFLGMVGWVQPFITGVFEDVAILRQLLKSSGRSNNAGLRWTPAARDAFTRLREALAHPDVLYAFDENRTLFMLTDASNLSGACIFMQLFEDENGEPILRIVDAVCHNFTAAELNYTTPEQELAALRAGCQRRALLVLGRTIVWLSDNTAVVELLRSARISTKKRLRTTCADLAGIHLIAVHISGKLNVLADALSRNPALQSLPPVDEDAALLISAVRLQEPTVVVAAFRPLFKSAADLRREAAEFALGRVRRIAPDLLAQAAELQLADDSLSRAWEAAATGATWRGLVFEPVSDGAKGDVATQRWLLAQLPRAPSDGPAAQRRMLFVVPKGLRGPVLEVIHAATAHGARARFLKALQSAFWWPTLQSDADAFIDACDACKRAVRAAPNGLVGDAERDELLRPRGPGDVWELDEHEWTLPTGHRIIVNGAVDKFSGFTYLHYQADKKAASAAACARQIHDMYGPFRAVHHDGGPGYHGEFEIAVKRLGATQSRGTPGNSNSQAMIENRFRQLNRFYANLLTHNPGTTIDPQDAVSAAMQALNSSWSRQLPGVPSTTPFERFLGRPPPFSQLLAATATPSSDERTALTQFVVALANEATVASGPPRPETQQARAQRRAAQVEASQRAAASDHGPPITAAPGDLVFLINPTPPMGKISNRVRSRLGPFRIIQLLPAPPAPPRKARIQLLGERAEELTVFLRDLQACGPALQIDDPVMRALPASGYFVAELAESDDPHAQARLQAIVDQALSPEQRAQVQSERAAWQRRLLAEEEKVQMNLSDDEDLDEENSSDTESDSSDTESASSEADSDTGSEMLDSGEDSSDVEQEPPEVAAPEEPPRRSGRPRRPSKWLDDFVRGRK
jgi:hypothetical protein